MVKRIAGKDGTPERLRYKYLLFEVNFDGLMEQYVDGLTRLPLEKGLDTFRWISGGSFGFPGTLPMPGFKRYIERNAYRPDYYWSAYPDATTTMVPSAVALRDPLRALKEAAVDGTVTDKEFDHLYREFLISTSSTRLLVRASGVRKARPGYERGAEPGAGAGAGPRGAGGTGCGPSCDSSRAARRAPSGPWGPRAPAAPGADALRPLRGHRPPEPGAGAP